MSGTVAVRECPLSHCCIATSQDCGEVLSCVFRSLPAAFAIDLAYVNSKGEASILFRAPFRDDDDTS
jgi:hypothetical protein